MTYFLFAVTLLVGAELGFVLCMVLMQKRIDAYRKNLDMAMKGWQESIDLLNSVKGFLDGVMPTKDAKGGMVSPIQIKDNGKN